MSLMGGRIRKIGRYRYSSYRSAYMYPSWSLVEADNVNVGCVNTCDWRLSLVSHAQDPWSALLRSRRCALCPPLLPLWKDVEVVTTLQVYGGIHGHMSASIG